MKSQSTKPYVKIIEQPAPDRARFRYQSETFSTLMGVSSTKKQKTYPTIQIFGYKKKAVVLVSCVTKDKPYRPHPFIMDGKEGCKSGVYTRTIPEGFEKIEFSNIGIKCVRKKDVGDSLKERRKINVDPFNTGIDLNAANYDLGSVRLCFQVFIKGEDGKCRVPLDPVVSEPIYDRKHLPNLVITRISTCICAVDEEPEIIILCGKIFEDDIQVRFYKEQLGVLTWEEYGSPSEVHRNVALAVKVPKYCNLEMETEVEVMVQLKRPSDNAFSAAIPFQYLPANEMGRKRKKPRFENLIDMRRYFEICGQNPFPNNMRFEKKVAIRRLPPKTPNVLPPDEASSTCQPNLPSTSGLTYQMNIPNIPETVQPGPNRTYFQNITPMYHPMSNTNNTNYQHYQNTMSQPATNWGFMYNNLPLNDISNGYNQRSELDFDYDWSRLANDTINNIFQI